MFKLSKWNKISVSVLKNAVHSSVIWSLLEISQKLSEKLKKINFLLRLTKNDKRVIKFHWKLNMSNQKLWLSDKSNNQKLIIKSLLTFPSWNFLLNWFAYKNYRFFVRATFISDHHRTAENRRVHCCYCEMMSEEFHSDCLLLTHWPSLVVRLFSYFFLLSFLLVAVCL